MNDPEKDEKEILEEKISDELKEKVEAEKIEDSKSDKANGTEAFTSIEGEVTDEEPKKNFEPRQKDMSPTGEAAFHEVSLWEKFKKRLKTISRGTVIAGAMMLCVGLAGGYYWGASQNRANFEDGRPAFAENTGNQRGEQETPPDVNSGATQNSEDISGDGQAW